jgi:predicted permease
MSRLDIRAGVRRLFRLPPRSAAEIRADVDEELASFLRDRADALVARGAGPEEARAEALRRLGGRSLDDVRERLYHSAARREDRMRLRERLHRLAHDVRFAARGLRRAPGFTLVAALTLALGIGASTAIFGAVNPILFEPLPYPHAERLITLWDKAPDDSRLELTFGSYRELLARTRTLDALAVARGWQPTLIGRDEPERLDGQVVSAGYFRTLGVRPALGRDLTADDERENAPPVVLIADGLWRRRFGADPAVLGRQIDLDGARATVVGVMPPGLENVLSPDAELWSPFQYPVALPEEGSGWGHNVRAVGRVRAGVSVDDAAREVATITRNPVPEFSRPPWASLRRGLTVTPLRDDVTRGVRPALLAVLGAVLLVLAIAAVNVTNLLLARGAQRRGEFAMRAAIGAGRGRMIRQLLTESVLLGLLAGALGVAVAALGVRALVALAPAELPRVHAVGLDATALAFALGTTTLVGLLVGFVPALHASRAGGSVGLQAASRRTAGRHDVTRAALVVAEVALALVLLVGAGLLLRSMERLFSVAPGFAPDHVLTMQVQTAGRAYDDDMRVYRFYEQALDAVRAVPGVSAAAWTSELPLSGDGDTYGAHFESSPTGRNEGDVFRYAVSPGYFATMRVPLVRGRFLAESDEAGAPLALVINESFARQKFPGQDPIGQHLHVGPDRGPWYTIVGVVGDVKQLSLATAQAHAVYITTRQSWFADRVLSLVVRTRAGVDPASLAPAVKRAVWSVDKDQPIVRVATMDALIARSAAERRFALTLFEAFAAVALALAAIGIYGVLAGIVTERVRELGVRAALGATRGDLLALVLGRGTALTALGVVVGVGGAVVASDMLVTLLFGVSRLDPVTYVGVVVLLLGVSALACAVPAWRAARVDPSITLRAD